MPDARCLGTKWKWRDIPSLLCTQNSNKLCSLRAKLGRITSAFSFDELACVRQSVDSRQFLRMDKSRERVYCLDFLKMYKARPALWNANSPSYRDRYCKKLAYHELAVRLRRFYPYADIDMAKRKIDSIRACLRRELSKIRKSRRAIALNGGKGEEYQPTWWLFPHLKFLISEDGHTDYVGKKQEEEEEESPWKKEREEEEEESLGKKEQDESNEIWSDGEQSEGQQQEQNIETVQDNCETLELYSDEDEMFDLTQSGGPCQRNEFLDVTSSNPRSTSSQNEHDSEADIYGRCWAMQYKELSADQKIYAKKAIEDIFFEAKLGTLQRNSVKINGT